MKDDSLDVIIVHCVVPFILRRQGSIQSFIILRLVSHKLYQLCESLYKVGRNKDHNESVKRFGLVFDEVDVLRKAKSRRISLSSISILLDNSITLANRIRMYNTCTPGIEKRVGKTNAIHPLVYCLMYEDYDVKEVAPLVRSFMNLIFLFCPLYVSSHPLNRMTELVRETHSSVMLMYILDVVTPRIIMDSHEHVLVGIDKYIFALALSVDKEAVSQWCQKKVEQKLVKRSGNYKCKCRLHIDEQCEYTKNLVIVCEPTLYKTYRREQRRLNKWSGRMT